MIAGLGMTALGKVYGQTSAQFAADAVRLAVADAGLRLAEVDGLLTSSGVSGGISIDLQRDLGLTDLRLLSHVQAYGSTAGAMVQLASMAVQSGMASTVACVFADSPLQPERSAGAVYGSRRAPAGWWGLLGASGVIGANPMYALAARRHMERFGTTSEQLGHIAVAQRDWAALNPAAQLRDPITLADHQASRWIVEPFHLLDCCLVSNGGIAVSSPRRSGPPRSRSRPCTCSAGHSRILAGISGGIQTSGWSPALHRQARPHSRWPAVTSPTWTWSSCTTATPSPCS